MPDFDVSSDRRSALPPESPVRSRLSQSDSSYPLQYRGKNRLLALEAELRQKRQAIRDADPSPTPSENKNSSLSSPLVGETERGGEGLSDSPFPEREGGWGVRFSDRQNFSPAQPANPPQYQPRGRNRWLELERELQSRRQSNILPPSACFQTSPPDSDPPHALLAPNPQRGSRVPQRGPHAPPLKRGENSVKVPDLKNSIRGAFSVSEAGGQRPTGVASSGFPLFKGNGRGKPEGDLGGFPSLKTDPSDRPTIPAPPSPTPTIQRQVFDHNEPIYLQYPFSSFPRADPTSDRAPPPPEIPAVSDPWEVAKSLDEGKPEAITPSPEEQQPPAVPNTEKPSAPKSPNLEELATALLEIINQQNRPPVEVSTSSVSPSSPQPEKNANSHNAVSQQMGVDLPYATEFNLGTIELEQLFDTFDRQIEQTNPAEVVDLKQRFEEFDRILDVQQSDSKVKPKSANHTKRSSLGFAPKKR